MYVPVSLGLSRFGPWRCVRRGMREGKIAAASSVKDGGNLFFSRLFFGCCFVGILSGYLLGTRYLSRYLSRNLSRRVLQVSFEAYFEVSSKDLLQTHSRYTFWGTIRGIFRGSASNTFRGIPFEISTPSIPRPCFAMLIINKHTQDTTQPSNNPNTTKPCYCVKFNIRVLNTMTWIT